MRRGRAKTFTDSRVQAAYERQRDLKATYQAVAHALKPALQELAERNVDELMQNPDRHREAQEHYPVIRQLQRNLEAKLTEHQKRRDMDLALAKSLYEADQYVATQEFHVSLSPYCPPMNHHSLCTFFSHALIVHALSIHLNEPHFSPN